MGLVNKDPTSLLNLQSKYLHDEIKRVQSPGGLYSLVIDKHTTAVLEKVLSKTQLLRIVTSVERIDDERKQNNYMEAIYFVDMSVFNLKCIAADAEARRYKGGIALFLPSQDPAVLHYFNGRNFLQNPVVDKFMQGRINFTTAVLHPVELRVFLADSTTPNSMPIYFNESCGDLVIPQIKLAAQALVNLMVLTEEMPLIRFYCPDAAMPSNQYPALRLPELIADEYQRQIDEYFRNNPDFPPPTSGDKPRLVLLIADRTLDLYAPLLHEFTYQAMAMDIVPLLERKGAYTYEAETETGELKERTSKVENEDDEDWVNLRHLHIIELLELIINRINELIKNNLRMVDRLGATTLSDLVYIMANLQGFDDERRQLTLHKTLIDECLDLNALRKLAEFAADFEQTCAAEGTLFEGERNRHLHDDLIVLLARDDLHVNDKMRLVLIYGLYRGGLVEADFIKLVKFIGVNDRHITLLILRCFTNLYKVGFPIVKKSPKEPKVDKRMFHTINNEGTFNTSRFGPGIKHVVQKAIKHQLDEDWFPYFREKPLDDDAATVSAPGQQQQTSLRNNRIKALWAQLSARAGGGGRPKQRVFVYVAGGMTYLEMRSMYELGDQLNKEVYIGSELILKPRDFLIGLQSIDKVKTPEDLDLALYKKRFAPKDPPAHLLPQQRPPAGMMGAPGGMAPGMAPGMSPGMNPGMTPGAPGASPKGQHGNLPPQNTPGLRNLASRSQLQPGFTGSSSMRASDSMSRKTSQLALNASQSTMNAPQPGSYASFSNGASPNGADGPVSPTQPMMGGGYRPPEPDMPVTDLQGPKKKKLSKLKKLFK